MDYGISAICIGNYLVRVTSHSCHWDMLSEGRVAVPHSGGVDAVEVPLLLSLDGRDLLF